MTVKQFLESLGLNLNDKVGKEDSSSDEPKSEIEALKAEIETLKSEIAKGKEPAIDNTTTKDSIDEEKSEVDKLKAELEDLKKANRDIILGVEAEPEKSFEENLYDLYRMSKGENINANSNA